MALQQPQLRMVTASWVGLVLVAAGAHPSTSHHWQLAIAVAGSCCAEASSSLHLARVFHRASAVALAGLLSQQVPHCL